MDIEEFKNFAKNKIEADSLVRQVRDVIKTTKWQKQDMREGFKETFKPLIKSQDSIKKSIDEQQNATIAQLKANQLALTQGLNQNRMAITEGFDKLDEVKKWDLEQLPGFEAMEEPKEDKALPGPTKDEPKIAQFTKEDMDRNLMSSEVQNILKANEYHKLPSDYFTEDISTIDNVIDNLNEDLEYTSSAIKNTAVIQRDPNGYFLAKPLNKKPHKNTLDLISKYNALSIYSTNLSNLKYYKTKSGSGMIYFNNPHQLLDRLELLGGSILAGNNGVINEFSQIAHLLRQMKVISKKQLNDLLKIGEPMISL
ncbi:hypothetical protein ABFA07_022023 [Porites harrisoni]